MKPHIPRSHPRYESLMVREKLVEGFKNGIVALEGLIAHGRGECFDYLIGERTIEPALRAMEAGTAMLLLAKYPVISVNGNVAALVPEGIVKLAEVINAKIEVNLFYRTREREEAIKDFLLKHGAKEVLGVGEDADRVIPELFSERRRVSSRGIYIADVVFVPLEDGDRTEALKKIGKKVVTVDLNPLSRTSLSADVTIVDNIVRAVPKMVEVANRLSSYPKRDLEQLVNSYNNKEILSEAIRYILNRLDELARELALRSR